MGPKTLSIVKIIFYLFIAIVQGSSMLDLQTPDPVLIVLDVAKLCMKLNEL